MNTVPNITIEQLTTFSLKDAEKIRQLAAKLGPDYQPLSNKDIKDMLASPNTYLLVARESKRKEIVGMVTVVIYRIPFVKKAYFDDLIVDESFRGQGIASLLLKKVLDLAKKYGAKYIDFTSRPNRVEANKLYEKFGFKKRDTNVYRLPL